MKEIRGAITALITPFKDGIVDVSALKRLIFWQVEKGIHGLVICGTTGESPTLLIEERKLILDTCLEVVAGRIPVIMGATSNSTAHAIDLVKNFSAADAVLIATPYYNKPSQGGIYQHYKAIYENTGANVVVYNIPGRCAVDIANDTMLKIMELPNIVALKDSTGDISRPLILRKRGVALLSGDDITALPYNVHGGIGCISVTANIVPDKCALIQDMCAKGDYLVAKKINEEIFPLNQALFYDTNPISVKYALSLLHEFISPEVRLPLVQSGGEINTRVAKVVQRYLPNLSLING